MGGGGLGLGPGQPPSGQPSSMSTPSMAMSVSQPLPSNVLSKQQSNMDQQYMQQSSQIYVFSTKWANMGAEAVMQDAYPSIVAWHEAQPDTKTHMEVRAKFRIESLPGVRCLLLRFSANGQAVSQHGEDHPQQPTRPHEPTERDEQAHEGTEGTAAAWPRGAHDGSGRHGAGTEAGRAARASGRSSRRAGRGGSANLQSWCAIVRHPLFVR